MANAEQVAILKKGAKVWNKWRAENPNIPVSLTGALHWGAALRDTEISRAKLATADLSHTDLAGVRLDGAPLMGANLSGTNLHRAELLDANLAADDLREADLTEAILIWSQSQ